MTTEEYSVGYNEGYQDGWNESQDEQPAIVREWVGLTDEEVEKIVDDNTQDDQGYDIWCSGKGVARSVEALLKERNT